MNIIDLKSKNQTKLINHDSFFLNLINLFENNKLPNKMIFSGPKGIGKSTLAYHLINYIFSKNEQYKYNLKNFEINDLNKSFNLVLNNTHPNFFLIDIFDPKKKVIEIDQVRKLINYSNKSAFNNKERIILIDNAESLNQNSSNALLKMIEEPNDNVFFILILDSSKKILETVKSRCIKFNLSMTFDECILSTNQILNNTIDNLLNLDFINHYFTIGDFINLVIYSKNSNIDLNNISLKDFLITIIDNKEYKKELINKNIIYKFVELHFLKLLNLNKFDKKIYLLYEIFINKIYNLKKFNLDEESFFIDFKTKVLDG